MHFLIKLLVTITLMEMMFAMGLRLNFTQLADSVTKNPGLIIRSLVANYLLIPCLTLLILFLFHTHPMVSAGLIILSVCPAAPYGPPFTAIAKGSLNLSVGLMVLLAGTSAFMAPLLLHFILPLVSTEGHTIKIDPVGMIGSLIMIQLLPLFLGLSIRQWRSELAEKLMKPASHFSKALNAVMILVIGSLQFPLLAEMEMKGLIPMILLLAGSIITGWFLGWPGKDNRKALSIITALRNMSLGMVIVVGSFPKTPAVTTVLTYAFIAGLGLLVVSLWWRIRSEKITG
jgi:bile acid:Na+ symporter, BASS family